jgi:hypothetical protein
MPPHDDEFGTYQNPPRPKKASRMQRHGISRPRDKWPSAASPVRFRRQAVVESRSAISAIPEAFLAFRLASRPLRSPFERDALTRRRNPQAREECWHVYFGRRHRPDHRTATLADCRQIIDKTRIGERLGENGFVLPAQHLGQHSVEDLGLGVAFVLPSLQPSRGSASSSTGRPHRSNMSLDRPREGPARSRHSRSRRSCRSVP